jgi:tetratricopeptide (TPR) repeat protein
MGQYDEAASEFMKVVNLAEDPAILSSAYFNMGNVFFRKGDYPAAMHLYQQALDRMPDSAEIHHNLNLVRQRMR